MRCKPCGTRHDKGEQAEQRDVGSGIDDDQEGSSHRFMVPRAPGLGLRQPWKRAEKVAADALANEKALRLEGFPVDQRYSGGGIRTRDLRVMSPRRGFVGTRWSSSAPANSRVGSDRVGLGSVG